MDTVVVFNTELSSLYDTRPPISKAKMASITRGAMKAIKFYKHVVQSVEKFILKCKPEYKVPGLYVIDSIVRQSRHQFGAEKDVFAPRFARNMQSTFANLFRCTPEDKSKIIRVLNLWQKNNVFAPEVIQPLFDFADPNHPIYQNQNLSQNPDISSSSMNINSASHSNAQESPQTNLDEPHTTEVSGSITIPTPSQLDSSTIRQLQQLQQFLLRQTGTDANATTSSGVTQDTVKFNKNLLDYDYGDDDEEEKPQTPRPQNVESNNLSQLLNDPNVLRQLQTLQKLKQQEEKQSKLTEMRLQEEAFEKHLATVLKKLPFANECDLSRANNDQNQIFGLQANINNLLQQPGLNTSGEHAEPEVELVSDDGKVEVINLDGSSRSPSVDRDRYNKRRRSRSRSRDRSGARRRRSRSRSRSPRSRRRNSRDRERTKDKEREREKEREYERERRRKGLPEIKKEHISVCSTTLWVGHLSKLVQQEELSDTFMKYGDIVSIDMIHPRGCAFIVMNRRQDAYKAIGGLKNYKLQGRIITISWAAGKGVKSKEWKDYWDLDLGVSYIPWNKLEPTTDFDALEEGGMFDDDTMPGWLKEKLKASNQKKDPVPQDSVFNMGNTLDTTQPPPGGASMMPNVSLVPPPFSMGPVQRLMPPMGLMPPNMVPGLTLGVPPPQINPQLLMQTGGMVPTVSHIPVDKSVPPPTTTPGNSFIGHFPPPIPGPLPPQIPQPIPHLPPVPSSNNTDDHMDIEMEDEPSARITNNQLMNVGPFNRPPPQMFNQNTESTTPTSHNYSSNKDVHDSRDRRRDRSNSRDRRSRDRDRDFRTNDRNRDKDRNRDRDRSDRDRDRRNDYNRDRDRNPRWVGDRARSRENDMAHRDRRNSRERDRNVRDRNERDKSLQDRLRDMASENARPEFNRRDHNDWRDGPPPGVGGNVATNFMDQGIRNIRPLNIGPMGGPPSIGDLMHNNRGPIPGANHRDFDYPRDDFDRRGPPPREFYNQNRFGPPGQVPRLMQMGMVRVGPPFVPRLCAPMFMRGPRPGPGQSGFNERPYFDRDVGNRGGHGPINDNRRPGVVVGGGAGSSRSNWNERDDDNKPANRFAQKDQPVVKNDSKKPPTKWNNASPKSVVSDEENWDDDEDGTSGQRKQNAKKDPELASLPQTEPIDDDSQEDDFNDFDENAPDVNDNDDINRNKTKIDDVVESTTETNSQTYETESFEPIENFNDDDDDDDDDNEEDNQRSIAINENNEAEVNDEKVVNQFSDAENQNTTPLYDELQDESNTASRTKNCSPSTTVDEQEPAIPGVDPDVE